MRPSEERMKKGLWWDRAWNLVEGCTPVSAACDNCWAASAAHMRASNPNEKIRVANAGLTDGGRFNGTVRVREDRLFQPLETDKPTVWAVWTDLFHKIVPEEFIRLAFETMAGCPDDRFLILTKRPDRMAALLKGTNPAKNVWFGTTVEDQATADERIPHLLATPAAKRFVSLEPLLGPVDLNKRTPLPSRYDEQGRGIEWIEEATPLWNGCLDWVVIGGESGAKARPMHPDWPRSIRDQCAAAGVPFFFKQWGTWEADRAVVSDEDEWGENEMLLNHDGSSFEIFMGTEMNSPTIMRRVGKRKAGRLLDGKEHNEWPEEQK